jgi:subtilisin family serine protease
MIMRRTALLLSLALPVAASANTMPAIPQTITIMPAGPLPADAQRLLADLGALAERTVPGGEDPLRLLRAHCGGSYTNDYYQLAIRDNPGFVFGPAREDRKLHLPACVQIDTNVVVQPLPGEDWQAFLKRHLGVAPGTRVSPCEPNDRRSDCNVTAVEKVAMRNGGEQAGLDKPLDSNRAISLPWKALPSTIVLKPGIKSEDALKRLRELQKRYTSRRVGNLGSASNGLKVIKSAGLLKGVQGFQVQPEGPRVFISAHEGGGMELIKPLAADAPVLSGTPCDPAGSTVTPNWPINQDAVIAAIESSRKAAAKQGLALLPAVVRVVDTGARGLSSYFPMQALAVNAEEKASPLVDSDQNGLWGDYYGFGVRESGDVEPEKNDKYAMHGTQVADVALGGYALRSAYPDVYQLVKLSMAKVFMRVQDTVLVDDATLAKSIGEVRPHPMPRVINLSVGTPNVQSTTLLAKGLREAAQGNILTVVAAGNDGKDIVLGKLTYPASYSGAEVPSSWLIAVGASGPNGAPARFTNFSPDRVDLLAPGCLIPFQWDSSPPQWLHGTSLAAPLVSFTAAAVHALGVRKMSDVKARIIASADHVPAAQGYTRFGGIVLNVERALRVYEDVLRVRGESTDLYGKWHFDSFDDFRACADGRVFEPSRLFSLRTRIEGGVTQLRALPKGMDGSLVEPQYCPVSDSRIEFVEADGKLHDVPLDQVEVLIRGSR